MKKFLVFLVLILGLGFCANANIRAPGYANTSISDGYEFKYIQFRGQAITTTNGLVFYADNIAGYSSIDFYGAAVSTGAAPTTISAQAIDAKGYNIGAAQVITSGTDLTDIKSPWYKFTYIPTTNRTITLNLLIAD